MDFLSNKGFIILIFATLLHGLNGIFSRFIGTGFGSFSISYTRALIILSVLFLYIFWKKNWIDIRRSDYKWFVLMSVPGIFSFIGTFIAFNHIAIGTVLFIFYASSTIGGYFLGRLIFKEKITGIKIISLILCLVGLFTIFSFSIDSSKIVYLLLSFIAGFCTASWNIFSKKISSKYPITEILFVDFVLTFAISLLMASYLKESISQPNFSVPWIGIVLFAFAAIGATFLTILGFRYMEAQSGTVVMLLEAVFGILFGWLFFKEILSIYSIIGGALIIFGIVLPNLKTQKTKPI